MVLVLQKNQKYVVGGNIPYFRLSLAPEQEGGEWKEVGAFWLKEKNGKKYYTGKMAEGVNLTFGDKKPDGDKKSDGEEINFD